MFKVIGIFTPQILSQIVSADQDYKTAFLPAVFSLTTLIVRVSVFINVVLIVVRAINITKPFYHINKKKMWAAIVICPVVLLPVILYDAVLIGKLDAEESKIKYIFLPFVGDHIVMETIISLKNVNLKRLVKKKKRLETSKEVTFLTSCAPFILAVTIALVCLVINWRKLARASKKMAESKSGSEKEGEGTKERHITVTIAILTAIFSVCNIIYAVFLTLYFILDLDWQDQLVLQLCYVTSTVFPFISSALNPIVLIWRSQSLRDSLKSKLCCSRQDATGSAVQS